MAVSAAAAIKAAEAKLGAKYIWGATGPNTFDCSGLTQWAWKAAGVDIPRTSQQQARYGTKVTLDKAQPGDLITSDWGQGPSSHVALYLGGGRVIHAPRPGTVVTYGKIDDNYKRHINQIRRVPGATSTTPAGLPGPVGGILGGGAEALGGTLLTPLRAMGGALGDMAKSLTGVGELATFIMRLALPSTWVRAACGVLGVAVLFIGLYFLVGEARGGA